MNHEKEKTNIRLVEIKTTNLTSQDKFTGIGSIILMLSMFFFESKTQYLAA